MKILIAGSDLNAVLLAQYIKLQNPESDIYITTEEQCEDKSYTPVNIKENDIPSVCDFVKYNQIEFTIVTSPLSIINGIADTFRKEGFPIFAPFSEAARITFFNSIAKKIMYKLKINTPKFGIFDRENLALDYIRRSKFPIVIENDFTLLSRESNIYKTFSQAKLGLQKIFENSNEKIVIENYIDSEPLYLYFITDGFNALPLIAIERNSGKDYTTVTAPCQKITEEIIINILRTAIYPLLDDITKFADNYTGIMGLKIKLQNNNYYALEFFNGFQHYDFQVFISLFNENLLNLLYDSAIGALADNRNFINMTDKFSFTAAINKTKIINYEETDEFIECKDNDKLILTNTAATINYAKENLYNYIETICDKETFQDIINSDKYKEIKI